MSKNNKQFVSYTKGKKDLCYDKGSWKAKQAEMGEVVRRLKKGEKLSRVWVARIAICTRGRPPVLPNKKSQIKVKKVPIKTLARLFLLHFCTF